MATVEDLARRVEAEQRTRLFQTGYEALLAFPGRYVATVHVGPKYTRIDFEGGKLMVVNATGEIFGIKGYGVIHRGHPYGTLDTIDEWDWSDYYPRRKAHATAAGAARAS